MELQEHDPDASRRPISARGNVLIQRIATALSRSPLTPNAISVLSIAFAAAGAAALLWLPAWGAWLCALAIQLRLLCNLFDGMVAVEGGKPCLPLRPPTSARLAVRWARHRISAGRWPSSIAWR